MLVTLAELNDARRGLISEFAVAADKRFAAELRERGSVVHGLGDVRLRRPLSIVRARRRLRQLLNSGPYDGAVCHAPWSHALFGGVVRACGLPCVLWQHDRATGTGLVERMSRAVGADLVVCNSEWTAASAGVLHPAAPHAVIYCPVTPAPVTPEDRAHIRTTLGASPSDVVILAASRLEPWKGHIDLIRALARVRARRWTLWIAGGAQRPHEREYERLLRGEIARLGISPSVRLLGERSDVRRLIAASDVLAQANAGPEPFGVVFAEALLAGVPVVTMRMGGAPEIVDDSCGRLVAPGDADGLVGALNDLISDRSLREQLGERGPTRAEARCAPALALARLEAALASVPRPTPA